MPAAQKMFEPCLTCDSVEQAHQDLSDEAAQRNHGVQWQRCRGLGCCRGHCELWAAIRSDKLGLIGECRDTAA